jgi:1,4-alpha-glucan branching enzyme
MKSLIKSVCCIIVIAVCYCQTISAQQILSSYPYFPTRTTPITITYNAALGNGALAGVSPIYFQTGLITDNSTVAPVTWNYVVGNWGTADATVKMNSAGGNLWTYTMSSINSYYGDNTTDTVEKMAFIFRNTSGTVTGTDALGNNLYLNVYPADSLECGFISPKSGSVTAATLGSHSTVFCAASQSCMLTLYVNGNIFYQGTADTFSYLVNFPHYGDYHLVLTASNGTQSAADSIDYIVNPAVNQQDPPAGVIEGINYINDSTVILDLLAPYKNFVYLLGDFNNWQIDTNYLMNQALDGQHWWYQVNHLAPMKQYVFQYDVDGAIRIGDPYCDEISDPTNDPLIGHNIYPNLPVYPTGKTTGLASVLQTGQAPYTWSDSSYVRPNKHNLMIYELLVRDFQYNNDYTQLEDSLDYLQKLGINAIELMPIMNFEGSVSWGYNPNYYCAPDKIYGTKATLKHFINTCHQKGIAVLCDIAFNDAFESCPMVMLYWDPVNQYPATNNPWFNQVAPHPYSVGYDFNHNSPYTQNYVDRVLAYWIQQYHVDGFRFDLAKGYTQTYSGNDVGLWGDYDTMRVRLLERMVDKVWNTVDSSSILIFEYFANNPEQDTLMSHNKGVMLWGYDMNQAYSQCTMGYTSNSDLTEISYQAEGYTNTAPNLVGYMESHDEERVMYNNETYGDSITGYDIKTVATGCERVECAASIFVDVPGPKMMWMFGERGYDLSINYNGRINPKPPRWNYMSVPVRLHLFKVYSALIKLKTTYPTFNVTDYNVDMANVVKKVWWTNPSVFDAQAIANFDVGNQTVPPYFQHTGWWYDYFSGDSFNVTDANMTVTLAPGEYHIYTDKRLPVPDLVDTTARPNGINEISAASGGNVLVYPLPASDHVNILSEDGQGIQGLTIYDIQGRAVFQQSYNGTQAIIGVTLPGDMNTGLYFYEVTVNDKIHTGKLPYSK